MTGVVDLRGLHDAGQHGIEQVVPDRLRVEHEKPLGIGVYPRFQSEVQHNRPGQRIVTLQCRYTVEGASCLIEQEEHDLFGQPQGARRVFTGDVELPPANPASPPGFPASGALVCGSFMTASPGTMKCRILHASPDSDSSPP